MVHDLGGSNVSGARFSVPGMPHIIVLNRQQFADRMRFTLSHELGYGHARISDAEHGGRG
nr:MULTISPECIES: ImmA/IrrE family metallo-endopeptidase [Bradyrhizobium]